MNEGLKRVIITDLDNTLFDWVSLWHACFTAMMGKVVEISGICARLASARSSQ